MISKKRLDSIYQEYLQQYELYSLTEQLSSIKSFEYMEGFFARINADDILTDKQLAYNFLDSENRSNERLNQALNRLETASEWQKAEVIANIESYLENLSNEIRDPNAPSEEVLREAYEDIKTFTSMREKAMTNPQYRKALIELFVVGNGKKGQGLLKAILSPEGFDDDDE